MSGTLTLRLCTSKSPKTPKDKLTIILLSHIVTTAKSNNVRWCPFGKSDDYCISINDVKEVKFSISYTCKNHKKKFEWKHLSKLSSALAIPVSINELCWKAKRIGFKFIISDACKNWEKENMGKDRCKKECVESYEGTE